MWNTAPVSSAEARQQLKLPAAIDGKVFALFPNLGFDAGKTRSGTIAFTSPAQWVIKTAEIFHDHPQHHLILKAHPAEHHRKANDSILRILRDSVDVLPANIHLVEATSRLTAKSIVELADIVIVYTSTVAVEAASLGKPVILVGGGWHAGRGVTIDTRTPDEYFALLERFCSDSEQLTVSQEMARRYAYAFFFRACLPLDMFGIRDINVSEIYIESLDDLAPGRCPTMDLLCRSVLFDEIVHAPNHDRQPVSVSR